MENEAGSSANAFSADCAIAGECKTIIVCRAGTDEKSVAVFASAEAGAGGDLGVIVRQHEVVSQAEHVHFTLDRKGEAVIFYGCAGFI